MNRKPWTAQEIDSLRRLYPDHAADVVGKVIGRPPRSVYQKAAALGIEKSEAFKLSTRSGRIQRGRKDPRMVATQFKPGQQPWNKGTNYVAGGRSVETRFKKGSKPHTTLPIGSYLAVRVGLARAAIAKATGEKA